TIWVATAGGGINALYAVSDTADSLQIRYDFRTLRAADGLPQDRINCLHIDSLNRVWFGTANRGLGYISQDSTIHNLTLPGNSDDNSVRSLAEDEFGFLWIGTAGGGVKRLPIYEPLEEAKVISFEEELTSNNVYLLQIDPQQELWIGTESGLDRASLDPDRNIIEVTHYGQAEGFVGIEVCQNAVWKDKEGDLWFGTINGLTHYNPRSTVVNALPPILSWQDISLFYTPFQELEFYGSWVLPWGDLREGLQLTHKQNTLSFDFMGIDHSDPDLVQYQWKLSPIEIDWRPVTEEHAATYAQLPPGTYTFLVRAVSGDGVWTPVPLEYSFEISPPYWQTWWFRAVGVAVITLLIGLLIKLRVDQVRKKAREETHRLEMEKDLLALEQKALRLQMNPHFIFHALNSIQSLISQQKDSHNARYFLAKFARLMRSVLENSREPMISLSDEIQMLEDYLSLEMFSRGDQFDYRIELDSWVDADEIMIPPMVLQPFVENAIIHGVSQLDRKGNIHLRFERINQHLECTITDDGVGRKQAAEGGAQQAHHQKSTALMVIQERLDILHQGDAQKEWDKSIEIVDQVTPEGTPAGTQVLVRIPIEDR
ncbi:MAG: histidine kinase, partial [Bacteroidota bacterium]